jgi:hypothetical protein
VKEGDYRRVRRSFPFVPASSVGVSVAILNAGCRSGCNIPCRGVPQTAHASAFKPISAPQHEQKAAMSFTPHHWSFLFDERKNREDSNTTAQFPRRRSSSRRHATAMLPDYKFVIPEESWACGPPRLMKNAFCPATALHGSAPLPFVIPSAAEGSAVLCTSNRSTRERPSPPCHPDPSEPGFPATQH